MKHKQKSGKAFKGKAMEGWVARAYNRNARDHIMPQYRVWARSFEALIPQGSKVLEVAPGPGYLSIELARAGAEVVGIDISESFVEIARRNAREAGVRVEFRQGNASALPFADESFTHVVCTSSFKNFSEPVAALREMHRVLVPGGIAWLSDLRGDVSDEEIDRYVRDGMGMKGLNAFTTRMTFKKMLRKRAYTEEALLQLVSRTPLTVVANESSSMELLLTMQKGAAI
ncbi:MAG TPA: class I SAM-dependent methyltransferase [Longimicrobiales bacterium]